MGRRGSAASVCVRGEEKGRREQRTPRGVGTLHPSCYQSNCTLARTSRAVITVVGVGHVALNVGL